MSELLVEERPYEEDQSMYVFPQDLLRGLDGSPSLSVVTYRGDNSGREPLVKGAAINFLKSVARKEWERERGSNMDHFWGLDGYIEEGASKLQQNVELATTQIKLTKPHNWYNPFKRKVVDYTGHGYAGPEFPYRVLFPISELVFVGGGVYQTVNGGLDGLGLLVSGGLIFGAYELFGRRYPRNKARNFIKESEILAKFLQKLEGSKSAVESAEVTFHPVREAQDIVAELKELEDRGLVVDWERVHETRLGSVYATATL